VADERDEIRARINIVDLVGQSVLLKKAGRSWKGLCPFHADKNPSFTVDPTMGSYRCWSCGEHGDVFTWVMKTRHVEFVEALQILAEQAGVTLGNRGPSVTKSEKSRWLAAMQDALAFFREQLLKNESALAYCDRRGLSKEVLAEWEIGYAPDAGEALATHLKKKGHTLAECKDLFLVEADSVGGYYDKFRGRLIFPIRTESGEIVAFGGRLLGDGHPKYINSGDTPLYRKSKVLYGMHKAKDALQKEKRAVLVEGYLDVVACHTAGVKGALASLGTSLAEDHAKLLRRWCEQVVILYDSDTAGQKAADRAVEILRAEGLQTKVALMPEGEDPDTLLRTAGPAAVQLAVEAGLQPLEYKIRKIKAASTPDQEEFWTAVVDALSTSKDEMEEDRYIVELAAMGPGVTDQISAQNALRKQVRRFRKQKKAVRYDEAPAKPLNPFGSIKLHPSEIAIFRGFLDVGLRQLSWTVCAEKGLFATEVGQCLADSLRHAFPTGPPTEKPAVWVARIEPESLRETFIVAQDDPRVQHMTPDFLEDSINKLRAIQHAKDIQSSKRELKGDDRLRDVYNKLKQRQPSENPDA
jgi:DNA primase